MYRTKEEMVELIIDGEKYFYDVEEDEEYLSINLIDKENNDLYATYYENPEKEDIFFAEGTHFLVDSVFASAIQYSFYWDRIKAEFYD